MTYVGEVKNGKIVLKDAPQLEEGSAVRVEVESLTKDGFIRGSSQEILHAIDQVSDSWAESADEMDEALEYLRKSKWDQVQAQQANPELGL